VIVLADGPLGQSGRVGTGRTWRRRLRAGRGPAVSRRPWTRRSAGACAWSVRPCSAVPACWVTAIALCVVVPAWLLAGASLGWGGRGLAGRPGRRRRRGGRCWLPRRR